MSDADVDDNTFESTDAGASEVCHPCKVAEVSTSKTGKHEGAPDCYPQVRKKSREERQMRDLPKAFRPGFLVHNGLTGSKTAARLEDCRLLNGFFPSPFWFPAWEPTTLP